LNVGLDVQPAAILAYEVVATRTKTPDVPLRHESACATAGTLRNPETIAEATATTAAVTTLLITD